MNLTFDIQSWWHAGTGIGRGQFADSVVNRDEYGMPYLPGRSVKGLLRSAMELAEHCGQIPIGRTLELFGSGLPEINESLSSNADELQDKAFQEGRYSTTPGSLVFNSATLPTEWRDWAKSAGSSDKHIQHFYQIISSTAVEDTGIVKDHSLRSIEVSIPLKLGSTLMCSNETDTTWRDDIKKVLPLIRHVGAHRNRGLGRVNVSVEGN